MTFILVIINKIAFFMGPSVAVGIKNSTIVLVDIFTTRIAGKFHVLIILFVYHNT